MSGASSVVNAGLVAPDRVRARVQGMLRAAQADGWTDQALADISGVCPRTIKSYRTEGKEPSLSNALSLMLVLGERGVNAVLSLIGYSAAPLEDVDAVNPRRVVADLLPHVSTLATAAADGRIDHTERPACRDAADRIIATVVGLSSAGGE